MSDQDYSPEEIALKLFAEEPKDPCTCQIQLYQTGADSTMIFEILSTILLEGFDMVTAGFKELDMSDFGAYSITAFQPWFNSLGFSLNVQEYDEKDKEAYAGYYCRVVVRIPLYETFFQMKNIGKNYHFLLNGPMLEFNKQKTDYTQQFMVFTINGKAYTISFSNYVPTNDIVPNRVL